VFKLMLIGVVAGLFSAVFGVGGGIVVVPLLVAVIGLRARPATATSLVAIGLISVAGTISYGARGYVDIGGAALVGLPGAAGALVGTTLQQRIPVRWLAFGFAALLAGIGIRLVVG
jgi:uncharacterized membrane protein YfcA